MDDLPQAALTPGYYASVGVAQSSRSKIVKCTELPVEESV